MLKPSRLEVRNEFDIFQFHDSMSFMSFGISKPVCYLEDRLCEVRIQRSEVRGRSTHFRRPGVRPYPNFQGLRQVGERISVAPGSFLMRPVLGPKWSVRPVYMATLLRCPMEGERWTVSAGVMVAFRNLVPYVRWALGHGDSNNKT